MDVTERTPVAFLRTANELALIDENGIILDRPLDGDFRFPVVSGLDDAMPLPDRATRMRLLRASFSRKLTWYAPERVSR